MKDIQSLHDSRRINIRKVGVKSLSYPIVVLDRANTTQPTLARMNMYVNLPHRFKGTHMSRFVEILNRFHGRFNLRTVQLILEAMKTRLDAEAAHLEVEFPYFLTTGQADRGPMQERYDCRLHGSLAQTFDLVVAVDVPVVFSARIGSEETASLPVQWGSVSVAVRMKRFLWIEDLIGLVEQGTTTQALHPATVATMCQQVSTVLHRNGSFDWYKVVVKNISSGYSTFASTEWPEPEPEGPDVPREASFSGENREIGARYPV